MWAYSLLNEYREGRKKLNKRYKEMNSDDPDRKIIGSMARDMTFVIEWLETGRMPGKLKGIDEKDVYRIKLGEKHPEDKIGVNAYWDDSINGFVSISEYTNPYQEIEDKIDAELEELKQYA